MGEATAISWCDRTWSPWYGCTQVSMGPQGACEGCYARQISETRFGRVVFGGPGRGEGTRDVRADSAWLEPLRWNRTAAGSLIFPSMCDPFDNHPALREPRRRFFSLIRATPNLTWLLLTKRPGNIVKLFNEVSEPEADGWDWVPPVWPRNAAIGCTVVSQEEADRDIPKLLAAKAALKPAFAFLSMEPLLGPVRLDRLAHGDESELDALRGQITFTPQHVAVPPQPAAAKLDWVITGGETDQGKHKARPADPAWFRSLRDQCGAAGVPFHFKQHGEWVSSVDAEIAKVPAWDKAPTTRFLTRDPSMPGTRFVVRIGKAHDPCTLDGVTHDARPAVRA